MSLTPEQQAIIQDSFAKASYQALSLTDTFYVRLFEAYPRAQELFLQTNMSLQSGKIYDMLNTLVNSIQYPERFLPIVADMGVRHRDYGVLASDYEEVGQALIWALGEVLQDDFTEPVREAWLKTYEVIAQTAISAAYSH